MLPNENDAKDDLATVLREGYGASEPKPEFVNRLQGQLIKELANSAQSQVRPLRSHERLRRPGRALNRTLHWLGGLNVRQRIMLSGVGVGLAAALALVLLWGSSPKPVSAMEKMAENIREAKSYKCIQIVRHKEDSPESRGAAVSEGRYTVYWLAPGSSRTEVAHPDSRIWNGPGPESTIIEPAGKAGIAINHRTKQFRRYPPRQKPAYSGVLDDLPNLGRFSGKADRELGTREINGKRAQGFLIKIEKMSLDASRVSGFVEVWLDPDSNLPLLVRYPEIKQMLVYSTTQEDTDIEWNIDLDPKLFDTTPPEGYADATPKPLPLEEAVQQITQALRIYAEASKGRYPLEGVVSDEPCDDLCRMLGLARWPAVDATDGNAGKAAKAIKGFDQLVHVQAFSPEFAYYGKTVGPDDKNTVLLRWKLDDGRYEVIFGDLRSETVTVERLRALEAK